MQKTLLPRIALVVMAAAATFPAAAQFTVSLGAQSSQLEVESKNQLVMSIPVSLNLNDSENNQDTDVGGELALGYQFNYDTTYNVAIEIFSQLSSTQVKVPISANGADILTEDLGVPVQDAALSTEWMAGVRMRPGYYITPAVRLFIDGGVLWGSFELTQDDSFYNYINNTLATQFDQSQTNTLFGWRYGAGVEYLVNEQIAIGLDYSVTEFNQFESDFIEGAASQGSILTQTNINAEAEYVPTFHTLGLNLKMLFGNNTTRKPAKQYYEMKDK